MAFASKVTRSGWLAGLTRNVVVLGLVSLFTDISSEMLVPVRILFLVGVLHTPLLLAGLIEGVAESTASLVKIFSGQMADRIVQRKPLIVLGYSLSNLVKPLFSLVSLWPVALGLIFLDRLGKGIRGSPRDALLAEATSAQYRGKAFGFHRGMDTAGAAVGPLFTLALLALGDNNLRLVFAFTALPGLASLVVLVLFLREKKQTRLVASVSFGQKPTNPPNVRQHLSGLGASFWLFTAISCIFSFGNSSDAFIFLRTEGLEGSLQTVPLIYFAYNLIYALLATPLGALSDRLGRLPLLVAGYGVFGLVYLGWSVANQGWQPWLLFLVYGIYAAATEGVSKAFISDLIAKNRRGTALGWFNGLTGLMALPANLLAGWLWTNFGATLPFAFGGLTSFGAAALLLAWSPWLVSKKTSGEKWPLLAGKPEKIEVKITRPRLVGLSQASTASFRALSLGLTVLLLVLSRPPVWNWQAVTPPAVVITLLASLLGLMGQVVWVRRSGIVLLWLMAAACLLTPPLELGQSLINTLALRLAILLAALLGWIIITPLSRLVRRGLVASLIPAVGLLLLGGQTKLVHSLDFEPLDVAVDSQGQLLVSDPDSPVIRVFSDQGTLLAKLRTDHTLLAGQSGFSPSGPSNLEQLGLGQSATLSPLSWFKSCGVAADQKGSFYLMAIGPRQLLRLDSHTGGLRNHWALPSGYSPPSPGGCLAVDNHYLYLADQAGSGRILALAPETGTVEVSWSLPAGPLAVSADGKGRVYALLRNNQVCYFETAIENAAAKCWSLLVPEDGSIAPYQGLAATPEQVFVGDVSTSQVWVFSPSGEGKLLGKVGGPGKTVGHLSLPLGLAVDHSGNLLVTDATYRVIQRFNLQNQQVNGLWRAVEDDPEAQE